MSQAELGRDMAIQALRDLNADSSMKDFQLHSFEKFVASEA